MDKTRAMQVFSHVAECGSFTKAAERLDIPPATVSTMVQTLEKYLEVRLLHRTTRKVTLTEEGAIYLERCTRLLADIDDMESLFAGPKTAPKGILRVDVPERLGRLTIIPALPDFFARYPGIQLKLSSTDRFVDLVGEAIDCVVRVGPLADSTLIARQIGVIEQINCASVGYLAKYGRPLSIADLSRHYAVNFFSSRTGRDLGWEYVEAGKLRSLKMRSMISVNSSEAYQAACLAGLGLAQIPKQGVDKELDSGLLEEVLPDFRAEPMPISIVFANSKQMSARARVFVDWVADLLIQ